VYAFIDLPLSFGLDTVLLLFTLPLYLIKGDPPEPPHPRMDD
jgi:uncharacterized protein YceK